MPLIRINALSLVMSNNVNYYLPGADINWLVTHLFFLNAQAQEQKLQSFTQYDFVPGDEILFYDDFSQDAIGDFPASWTTNGSGEVKTLNLAPGNWFHMNGDEAVYSCIRPISFPEIFISYGIYFDSGKDVVKPESYGALKDIANVLKENPDIRVKILGHTDSDGDEAMNLALSKRRAESVRSELIKTFSVNASMMDADGAGENQSLVSNASPEGKAKNRRVEFIKL